VRGDESVEYAYTHMYMCIHSIYIYICMYTYTYVGIYNIYLQRFSFVVSFNLNRQSQSH